MLCRLHLLLPCKPKCATTLLIWDAHDSLATAVRTASATHEAVKATVNAAATPASNDIMKRLHHVTEWSHVSLLLDQ